MSWPFVSKPSLADEKLKQIKDLRSSFPEIVQQDQYCFYEIRNVTVLGETTTTMKIYLDAVEFPMKGPTICVDKDLSTIHQWVDGNGNVIGCDQLKNWDYKKSSLVNIVTTIKNALQNGTYAKPHLTSGVKSTQSRTIYQPQLGLPAISGTQNNNTMSMYPAVAYYNVKTTKTNMENNEQVNSNGFHAVNNNNDNYNYNYNNSSKNSTPSLPTSETLPRETVQSPDIPASFPFLNTLDVTQLKRFFIGCKEFDQKTFDSHINDDKNMISIKSFKNDIMKNNFQLCVSNIKVEEKLLENYDILQTLKSELQDLLESHQKSVHEIIKKGNKSESHSRQKLSEKLQSYDQAANAILTKYFSSASSTDTSTVPVSAIMREYLDARKKYYALRSKMDAIKDCI